MTSHPASRSGHAGRRSRPPSSRGPAAPVLGTIVVGAALVGALVAGCTTGTPGPSGTPDGSATAGTPIATSAVSAEPAASLPTPSAPASEPSPPASPVEPPGAALAGDGADAVPGALGSYTWADHGSDAPWIVVGLEAAARGAGPWTVTFEPPLGAVTWTAAWAPITAGGRGEVAGSGQGSGPIAFPGPEAPGDWSLKLDVDFDDGRTATYYFRLETER